MSYGLLIFRNLVLFLLKNKFLIAQTAIMAIFLFYSHAMIINSFIFIYELMF